MHGEQKNAYRILVRAWAYMGITTKVYINYDRMESRGLD
jgi:hypothetical protein